MNCKVFELSGKHEILSLFYVILRFQPHFPAFPSVLATILCSLCLLHCTNIIIKFFSPYYNSYSRKNNREK